MKYYGYTKEQIDRMMFLFNAIDVKSMEQIDAYHEATTILRHPAEINVAEEGDKNGKEIYKTELAECSQCSNPD